MSIDVYLAEACRWFVLIALLAAAIGKSVHFHRFRESLDEGFQGLGRGSAAILASLVLAGEWSAAALMLAEGGPSRVGLMLSLVLFVLLTLVVVVVLARDLTVRCNCFGAGQQRISGFDLARNLMFIAAAGIGLQGPSATGVTGALGGLPIMSSASIAIVALMLFLLCIHLRDVAHLMQIRAQDL